MRIPFHLAKIGYSLEPLEKDYGGKSYIAVSTKQTAIQMCLELLGSRMHAVPCILPITASTEALSGVLRSGAQPLLLDISPETLHLDEKALQMALEELPGAVVVLSGVAGHPLPESLLEALSDVPTVIDWNIAPRPGGMAEEYRTGTFNVYDFVYLAGFGALIECSYERQQQELRMLRDGELGHSGGLPNDVCDNILCRGMQRHEEYNRAMEMMKTKLYADGSDDIILWEASEEVGPMFLTVPNAQRTVTHLLSYEVEARLGVFPLHRLDVVKDRYIEVPEYPAAEQISKSVIKLPTNRLVGTAYHANNIVRWMKEII